jgi:hypothetical protein
MPGPVHGVGRTVLLPRVAIISPVPGTATMSPQITLHYKAESDSGPITATEVRVNGRPAQEAQHVKEPAQTPSRTASFVGWVTVTVPPELATVDIIARNAHGASEAASFVSTWAGGLRAGTRGYDGLPDVTKFANELADADAGIIVFASSTGRELSLELDPFQHGAFTQALLEGFRGRADYTQDAFIDTAELETYLADRVKELTQGRQKPVTAKPEAVPKYHVIHIQQRR